MDVTGQISAEFIMLTGFMLLVTFCVAICIGHESELIHAMAAARSGASEGVIADSQAIYPDEAYSDYNRVHNRLISPSGVKIIKIDYLDQGYYPLYNRTKIQLRIYATGPPLNKTDLNCLGERINFHARKSICEVFKTENLTNSFFNPAFSDKYVFTTGDVHWI
ncbi:MAG: hypothetical protein LLF83_07480 [Methanobacterium sp.]|nr:hypothetical protein [Methanobacterium sp.]